MSRIRLTIRHAPTVVSHAMRESGTAPYSAARRCRLRPKPPARVPDAVETGSHPRAGARLRARALGGRARRDRARLGGRAARRTATARRPCARAARGGRESAGARGGERAGGRLRGTLARALGGRGLWPLRDRRRGTPGPPRCDRGAGGPPGRLGGARGTTVRSARRPRTGPDLGRPARFRGVTPPTYRLQNDRKLRRFRRDPRRRAKTASEPLVSFAPPRPLRGTKEEQ